MLFISLQLAIVLSASNKRPGRVNFRGVIHAAAIPEPHVSESGRLRDSRIGTPESLLGTPRVGSPHFLATSNLLG